MPVVQIDRNLLSDPRYQKRPTHTLPLFVIGLLLSVVAIAQLGWFTLDTSARHPGLRPIYASACGLLGCELPGIQDVRLIKTSNTFFTVDPENPVYLVVDTLITNTGDEAQVYPDLEVEFSSLEGKLIARHRFTPAEYLGGEVHSSDLMPAGVPVHIDMVVDNPGPAAVSRSLTVHANL